MGLKKFVRKAGNLVKKAAAVYATVQTGGLAGAAIGLAQKAAAKGKRPRAMPGGVMTQAGFEAQGIQVQEAALPALLGAGVRALPGLLRGGKLAGAARKVGGALKTVAGGVATAVVADRVIDAAGNVWQRKKRSRRINPLNVRAARRAIRRIKGVRKIAAQIERSLPKQKASRSASCPPFVKKKC